MLSEWAQSMKQLQEQAGGVDKKIFRALEHLLLAQMLYGLALETAFKAHLLATQPTTVDLQISSDGAGNLRNVEIREFGVSLREGHNLLKLAEQVGVFYRGAGALFQEDSDLRATREILIHLTEVVMWSARYPVPTRSTIGHVKPGDVPGKVYGHYIRDWVDPILDRYLSQQ